MLAGTITATPERNTVIIASLSLVSTQIVYFCYFTSKLRNLHMLCRRCAASTTSTSPAEHGSHAISCVDREVRTKGADSADESVRILRFYPFAVLTATDLVAEFEIGDDGGFRECPDAG